MRRFLSCFVFNCKEYFYIKENLEQVLIIFSIFFLFLHSLHHWNKNWSLLKSPHILAFILVCTCACVCASLPALASFTLCSCYCDFPLDISMCAIKCFYREECLFCSSEPLALPLREFSSDHLTRPPPCSYKSWKAGRTTLRWSFYSILECLLSNSHLTISLPQFPY